MTLNNGGMAGRWDDSFGSRKSVRYKPEDDKVLSTPPSSLTDKEKLVTKFFEQGRNTLQPPNVFKYPALHRFFQESSQKAPFLAGVSNEIVLLDERNDPKSDGKTPRAWDSTGEDGYLNYPPTGDIKVSKEMRLAELSKILSASRLERNVDRRTIFVPNLSRDSALLIGVTASMRTIPSLRSYFEQHLQMRSSFSASINDNSYTFEFHIPYYAIRRGSRISDRRKVNNKPLRASRVLPLAVGDSTNDLYYYEAQLSFVVTGVDEWRYTSYCCVDTYFGSEPRHLAYLEPPVRIEPAAGGRLGLELPKWNPREYFLVILSFRIEQAVTESQALIDSFEDRMNSYRDEALNYFLDDEKLSRTEELTRTVLTLQRFHDCYTRTIQAWEAFDQEEIQAFEVGGSDVLRSKWQAYILKIKGEIAKLRSCTVRLHQHLVLFDGMKAGIVGASSLRESSASTRHSNFLRVLTLMTVVYLPLSCTTGILSMSIVPATMAWWWFPIILTCLSLVTALGASYINLFGFLKKAITPYGASKMYQDRIGKKLD